MPDEPDRDDRGQYVETLPAEEVLAFLRRHDEPMTATDVGETFDVTNRTALNKLEKLHDRGAIERKQVGARAVVWWTTDGSGSDPQGRSRGRGPPDTSRR